MYESNDERAANISLKKPWNATDCAFFAEAKDAKRTVEEMKKAIRDAEGQLAQGPSVAVGLSYGPGGIAVAESAGDAPACISVYG